jgi:hypothetical protein
MFNAALTTLAIDVVLPHCDAAKRSRQREKSRHVRDLKECCSGDTQRRRNARFPRPRRRKSRVSARAAHNNGARRDESGRAANARANRPHAGAERVKARTPP